MVFKRALAALVGAVPGATGAILADWEGEAVEQHCVGDPFEMKVTAAHWGILLSRMQGVRRQSTTGYVEHSVITTSAQYVIVGAIGDEYTLVMTMSRDALPLLALRRFMETSRLLHKEIY
jgi:predicted regulator of Ras-like GTPase activity (Roadblock/LC7/MglB family)